jgi:ParB family transcriptional regulator, chromosome partitioning protein
MARTSTGQARPAGKRRLLAPEAIGVKQLRTEELFANPHNPRMLFDKAPMDALQESIAKVGILVPLTVYRDSKRNRFIILDGQRRWISAQNLKLATVPVNQVAEPTLVQNIVTMFQIHKVREDWELMPTALKLEVLMQAMNERREATLATLTGLDQAVVSRCKKLLTYTRRFQDTMLDPDPDKRIKADFFIELYAVRNDRFVNTMPWFRKDRFTRQMLAKYEAGSLKAVTDFRLVKQYINNARKASKRKEITRRLREFATVEGLRVDHLLIPAADVSANARRYLNDVNAIYTKIDSLEVDDFFGEEALWERLEELSDLIRRKLREVGRRLRT